MVSIGPRSFPGHWQRKQWPRVVTTSIQVSSAGQRPACQRNWRSGVGGAAASTRLLTLNAIAARTRSMAATPGSPVPMRQCGPSHCNRTELAENPLFRSTRCHRPGSRACKPAPAHRSRYGVHGLSVANQSVPPGASTRAHSSSNASPPSPSSSACCSNTAPQASVASGNGNEQRTVPTSSRPFRCSNIPRRPATGGAAAGTPIHTQGIAGQAANTPLTAPSSAANRPSPASLANQPRPARESSLS